MTGSGFFLETKPDMEFHSERGEGASVEASTASSGADCGLRHTISRHSRTHIYIEQKREETVLGIVTVIEVSQPSIWLAITPLSHAAMRRPF